MFDGIAKKGSLKFMNEELKELVSLVYNKFKTKDLLNVEDEEGSYFLIKKITKPEYSDFKKDFDYKEALDEYIKDCQSKNNDLIEISRTITGITFNPLMCRILEKDDHFEVRFQLIPNDIITATKITTKRLEQYHGRKS